MVRALFNMRLHPPGIKLEFALPSKLSTHRRGHLIIGNETMRPSKRAPDEMRKVSFERNIARYAEGSCLVKFGETHVLCTASLEEKAPSWLRGSGKGWVTAEYSMLPRATVERTRRESTSGKQSGRTQEIQRLIGRSLRSVVDLTQLNEKQITLDCDVIQADGGTRTASITGGYVAIALAVRHLQKLRKIKADPLHGQIASVSVGIYKGLPVLDLDYQEDSDAETDMNVVMNDAAAFVELQGTAEGHAFRRDELDAMLILAEKGIKDLLAHQREALAAVKL